MNAPLTQAFVPLVTFLLVENGRGTRQLLSKETLSIPATGDVLRIQQDVERDGEKVSHVGTYRVALVARHYIEGRREEAVEVYVESAVPKFTRGEIVDPEDALDSELNPNRSRR